MMSGFREKETSHIFNVTHRAKPGAITVTGDRHHIQVPRNVN
jgi:hypothetical protein